ncbi:MAG: nucleotidyl transferase AbiEii/AbiGii toxin family protein [Verrucomicrobiota bacterium]
MDALNLHYGAAPAPLLDLLRSLMREDLLEPFHLVGGTALALRLGHRSSVDIDLFAGKAFDVQPVADLLGEEYGIQSMETARNTVRGEVGGIKVDIMSHRYPMIGKPIEVDGIRLASLEDIAAMKLNAIANRGGKKDFWDYAELLNHFSRDEMLGFFAKKYTDENVWYVEKSLSYFEDAEEEPDPRGLKGHTWSDVKKAVLESNRL